MKNLFILSFIAIALFSCNQSDETISDDRMVDILTDMLIVDELLVKYGDSNPDNYRDSMKMLILQKYNLDSTDLDRLMINVQKNLKHYHLLQEKVGERLDSLKRITEEKR